MNGTKKRKDNANEYRDKLQDVKQIRLPKERESGGHVYHLFAIMTEKRDELSRFLNEKEIDTGLHYPVPIHLQGCFKELGYKQGDFPVSESLSRQELTLPMFPTMDPEEISHVTKAIKEFFNYH